MRSAVGSTHKTPEARNEHADRGTGSEEADLALQEARGNSSDRKLIVFDFDRTIMKEHMWNKYRDTPISRIHITDDHFVDLPKFRGLVLSLRRNGHNVAVATFGRRDVVDKALHHALGEPHNISVRTPADFGFRDGSGRLGDKNTQLAELAKRYNVSAEQIIFLDDDPHNIEAAARAGVVHSQWVPDGLTKTDILKVAEQVGVRPLTANEANRQISALKAKAPGRGRAGRRDTGPLVDMSADMLEEELAAFTLNETKGEERRQRETPEAAMALGMRGPSSPVWSATSGEAATCEEQEGSPSSASAETPTRSRAPRRNPAAARHH